MVLDSEEQRDQLKEIIQEVTIAAGNALGLMAVLLFKDNTL